MEILLYQTSQPPRLHQQDELEASKLGGAQLRCWSNNDEFGTHREKNRNLTRGVSRGGHHDVMWSEVTR